MKLYKLELGYEPNGCKIDVPVEATPAEINDAHPKCGVCMHVKHHFRFSRGFEWHACEHPARQCHDMRVNPTTDYCNKWEPKK